MYNVHYTCEKYEKMLGNRLCIVGSINKDTPACVIMEIAESMRFKLDRRLISDDYISALMKGIRHNIKFDNIGVNINLNIDGSLVRDDDNLSNVARLLNSDLHTWDIDTLEEAFEHLIEYGYGDGSISNLDDLGEYGRKTPHKPLSMDACMLYKHCLLHSIRCHRWQKEEDMYLRLKCSIMDKGELVELLCMNACRGREWKRDIDLMSGVNNGVFSSMTSLLHAFTPRSHEESIYLSIKLYNLDISYANNPSKVYKELTKMLRSFEDEADENGRQINTDLSLYEHEGFVESAIEEAEDNNLLSLWKRDNRWLKTDKQYTSNIISDIVDIYEGIHPLVSFSVEFTYISKDRICDIDEKLFTIGKLSEPNELYVLSVSELSDTFFHRGYFSAPHDANIIFNSSSVLMLRTIPELSVVISHIDNNYNHLIKFINRMDECDDSTIIRKYIIGVRNLAFIMRGWNGDDDLPLKSIDTITDDYDKVEELYADQSRDNAAIYNNMSPSDQQIVDDIPLMTKVGDTFVRVINDNVGTTLSSKIKIIEDNQDENACIRLSSNYLLETCWYFLDEVYDEVSFDINEMSNIS
jgi:hypothetical protein